jgi:hypothetical protein
MTPALSLALTRYLKHALPRQTPTPAEKRLIRLCCTLPTIRAAAAELGKSESVVSDQFRKWLAPFANAHAFTRQILYRRSDVLAFLEGSGLTAEDVLAWYDAQARLALQGAREAILCTVEQASAKILEGLEE